MLMSKEILRLKDILDRSKETRSAILCDACVSWVFTTKHGQGWSCGYDNIMMLCSYLRNNCDTFPAEWRPLPTLLQLQIAIEDGWRRGIDRAGCASLDGQVKHTKKFIGTTECYTIVTAMGIR